MTHQYQQSITTPLGELEVLANEAGITHVQFVQPNDAELPANSSIQPSAHGNAITALACQQLTEYFAGQRHDFSLPLVPSGTAYQQRVWAALLTIPYGTTCSYIDIAMQIDQPTGSRSVGMANSKNPLGIVIPCHRVIGKNGTLTGYAGGLDKKSWLLNHESSDFTLTS